MIWWIERRQKLLSLLDQVQDQRDSDLIQRKTFVGKEDSSDMCWHEIDEDRFFMRLMLLLGSRFECHEELRRTVITEWFEQ